MTPSSETFWKVHLGITEKQNWIEHGDSRGETYLETHPEAAAKAQARLAATSPQMQPGVALQPEVASTATTGLVGEYVGQMLVPPAGAELRLSVVQ